MSASFRERALAEWRGYREPAPLLSRVNAIGDLLGKTMQGLGLSDRVREAEIIQAWKDVVGEFIAAHSMPSRLREGVLYVQVLQPAIHFELERVWKREILLKLKARFGGRTIREVRFRVG